MMSDDLFDAVIVVDVGSSTCRAGFAGDDVPSVIFPSVVGIPRHQGVMPGTEIRDSYVGDEAQSRRGIVALRYPKERGVVTNWDDMEKVLQYAFFYQLRVDPKDHPVLFSESLLSPKSDREKLTEMMFETFQTPAMLMELEPVLAMYSAGKITSTILVSGEGLTQILPIYEGRAIPEALVRQKLAGQDVTEHLMELLRQRGYSFSGSADYEIVKDMKEKLCYVSTAADFDADVMQKVATPPCHTVSLTSSSSSSSSSALSYPGSLYSGERTYNLPDGQVITVGNERFHGPEALFRPSLVGQECLGLHEALYGSIVKCPIDIRRDLFSNTALCGGNTLFPWLAERLEREVRSLAPRAVTSNVRGFPERDFHVWIGGSVLGSLTCYKGMWLTRGVYDEFGPHALRRTLVF